MGSTHISVLLHEAVEALQVKPDAWFIDGTFGRGGHTREILKKGGKVLAFDVDQEAIDFGQQSFSAEIATGQLKLIRENFDHIGEQIRRINTSDTSQEILIQGALFDFGLSSPQLDQDQRGFSFHQSSELDMRMDSRLGVQAKDLLAVLPEKQLANLFFEYGGEEMSRSIAKRIVYARERQAIHSVAQLVDIITSVKRPKGHLHPATKVFQALRIAVNDELGAIKRVLPQVFDLLIPAGRLVTISFHEGEDRIVKNLFRSWDEKKLGVHLTQKVTVPTDSEIEMNPRSRSAKMRIFEKRNI